MFRMMVPLVAAACLLAVHTPTLSAAQSKPASRTTTAKPAAGKVVNINTASVAELNGLPGIGAKTAALIVE
jgi:DNA uptake protein ComE-like DNA-binding protein